jgi:ABC-type nitrate/sulfonate/bicarbonate transport system substrate-binding protein
MKTMNSLFAVSLIAAALGAASVHADSTLVSPHWKDAPQIAPATGSVDYAHAQTALGNAAKSKAAGPVVVPASGITDPNLIARKQVGRASCPVCGAKAPCCARSASPCCK